VGSHDDTGDFPLAVDEDADLPVDAVGYLGKIPRELVGQDYLWRYFSTVETLYLFDIFRLQAGKISVNPLDGPSLLATYCYHAGPSSIGLARSCGLLSPIFPGMIVGTACRTHVS
jgi:hypothetical protein